MATSVYVNNAPTQTPGSYTAIDASGLLTQGLGASGIVAVIGQGLGAASYAAVGQNAAALPAFTTTQQALNTFAGGDLLDGVGMLFDPSSDPNLTGGASVVIALKVNPSTQSTVTLASATGPAVVLTSQAYGVGPNALAATVVPGSTAGTVALSLNNTTTGALELFDNLASAAALLTAVNATSALANAALAPAAVGTVALITAAAAPFSGGSDTLSATFTDWQNCLNLLKQLRVNSVVALSSDPSIASAVQAHCSFMCGQGQSERDGFVGIQNGPGVLATLPQIKQQTLALNSRHIRACVQNVSRFNSKGVLTVFPPHFMGCIAAGMQAGAPVGFPLTNKYIKAQAIAQDPGFNPLDNSNDLIAAGALVARRVDGQGIRWVRNVTTYQQDNNLAFVEGSVNQAVNYAAFTLRNALQFAVGRPGFSGTANAIKSTAYNVLDQLITSGAVRGYNSFTITPVADAYQISLALAPVLPVNFIVTTIHLSLTVGAQGAAAAA